MQLRNGRIKSIFISSIGMAMLLIGLPLAGVAVTGAPLSAYLEFPPLTRHVIHAGFSWTVFGIFSVINLLMLAGIGFGLRRAYIRSRLQPSGTRYLFPAWGWGGLTFLIAGWIFAWQRFDWFAPFQPHTFCLPWFGYIILVNALCVWRSGRSPLTDYPQGFWLLFPLSAVFWWFFEYLNRFVQNWYYVGPMDLSPLAYTLFASLAFATVLPAVLGTYRFLLTFKTFGEGLKGWSTIDLPDSKVLAGLVLMLSAAGLFSIGRFPDQLFALVWGAPMLLIISFQALGGHTTLFSLAAAGDWRPIIAAAVAALFCGFLWEMWNIGSLAHWKYAIPFVDRYHIFAMPVLGYGGYLPFGLECLVIIQWVIPKRLILA